MAEDFGAKPHSSQTACLSGVEAADVMVLVLGSRYGFIARSGKAVTEEELDCARARGIPVLIFVEKVDREPDQEQFLNRLRSYEEGYHLAFFTTPEQLKDEVVRALNDFVGSAATAMLDSAAARSHLDKRKWASRRPSDHETWFGLVVFAARAQSPISARTLGSKAFQDPLVQAALFGTPSLFNVEVGTTRGEVEDGVVFNQGSDYGLTASIAICSDGTISFGRAMGKRERNSLSLVRGFVIDEDEFKSTIGAFLRYANVFYGSWPDNGTLTSFYVGGSLTGLNQKSFGRIPAQEPSSIGISMSTLPDPLYLPKEPQKIARADLVDPESVSAEITELVARTFRAGRAYYTP